MLVPPVEGRSRNTAVIILEGLFSVLMGSITAEYGAEPLAAVLPFVPVSSAPSSASYAESLADRQLLPA